MKLIAGLGNPGNSYAKTRHNVGFMALNYYLENFPGVDSGVFKYDRRFESDIAILGTGSHKVAMIKPQTYMNRSGQAIRKYLDYYDMETNDALVVYDELALPFGSIRTRLGGESAGHKGIESIIKHCGDGFSRLRIGINNDKSGRQKTDEFVLSSFSRLERDRLPDIFANTSRCIDDFINSRLQPETLKIPN